VKSLWWVGWFEFKWKGMDSLNSFQLGVGDLQSVEVLDDARWDVLLKNILMEAWIQLISSLLDFLHQLKTEMCSSKYFMLKYVLNCLNTVIHNKVHLIMKENNIYA